MHATRTTRIARRVAVAALAMLLAGAALGQSAGMGRLLGRDRATPAHVGEPGGQRDGRGAGKHHRSERASVDHRNNDNSNLSPDERRRLRQNLYELSREMYRGN